MFESLKVLFVIAVVFKATSAIQINCRFEYMTWISMGSRYCCLANVTEWNDFENLHVTGVHMVGKTNADVQGFEVKNDKNLKEIPLGLEVFFPNLLGLHWYKGVLGFVDARVLKPFPKMVHFSLSYNSIVSIDSDLFSFTPNLRVVLFLENALQHVGANLLSNLPDLYFASFEKNPCIDITATTVDEVRELNELLPVRCPFEVTTPSTTTESGDCPEACSAQNSEIIKRVAELEHKVRELMANTCAWSIHSSKCLVYLFPEVKNLNKVHSKEETFRCPNNTRSQSLKSIKGFSSSYPLRCVSKFSRNPRRLMSLIMLRSFLQTQYFPSAWSQTKEAKIQSRRRKKSSSQRRIRKIIFLSSTMIADRILMLRFDTRQRRCGTRRQNIFGDRDKAKGLSSDLFILFVLFISRSSGPKTIARVKNLFSVRVYLYQMRGTPQFSIT